jgi:hypothetical protein
MYILPYLRRDDIGPLSVVYPPTESEFIYLLFRDLYLLTTVLVYFYNRLGLLIPVVYPPTEIYFYNRLWAPSTRVDLRQKDNSPELTRNYLYSQCLLGHPR